MYTEIIIVPRHDYRFIKIKPMLGVSTAIQRLGSVLVPRHGGLCPAMNYRLGCGRVVPHPLCL